MHRSGLIQRNVVAHLEHQLGRPAGDAVTAFCDRFRLQLNHFSEYGVRLDTRRVAVMTLGCGRAFGREVGRFATSLGFAPDTEQQITDLQAAIDTWMLVRVAENGGGPPELGLYFRKAMPLPRAREILGAGGVDEAEMQALEHLGGLLDSERTGIFGAMLRPGATPWFKVYLHAYDQPTSPLSGTLARVFDTFKTPTDRWTPFVPALEELREAGVVDAFVSLLLGDGDPFDSVKVDFFQVPLAALERALDRMGLLGPDVPSPARIGAELNLDAAEHVGLRFTDDGVAVSVYYVPSAATKPR